MPSLSKMFIWRPEAQHKDHVVMFVFAVLEQVHPLATSPLATTPIGPVSVILPCGNAQPPEMATFCGLSSQFSPVRQNFSFLKMN